MNNNAQMFVSIISHHLFPLIQIDLGGVFFRLKSIHSYLVFVTFSCKKTVITPLNKFIDFSTLARIIIIVNHANNDTVACIFDQWMDIVSTFVVRSVECVHERCHKCALMCACVRVDGRRPDAFETDVLTYDI